MSEASARQTSLPWSSSAAAFLAKTCPARERAKVLLESARASGVSSLVWSERLDRDGSLSKTSRAVLDGGLMRSCVSWKSSAMRAYRSLSRRVMSALLICESASSLLPTLTTNPAPYSRRRGVTYPGLLPTLLSSAEERGGSTYGRGNLTLRGTLQSLPTLCTRDEKGPGSANKTRGGKDLPQTLGGHLNPDWCRWFMGFPVGWLDVDDAPAFVRSATRSFRNAPKSSAT